MSNQLVGRRVRFDGQHQGYEGIVLDAKFDGHHITLILEVTKAIGLPAEIDGAHPIRTLYINLTKTGIYVMPLDIPNIGGLGGANVMPSAEKFRPQGRVHIDCFRMPGGTAPCACIDGCGACDSCGAWLGDADHQPRVNRETQRLLGCSCGFECSNTTQLSEHLAAVQAEDKNEST